MRIAMIGCGKLGLPCAEVMSSLHNVIGYDINPIPDTNIDVANSIKEAVTYSEIIFVAVPTPHDPAYDGSSPIKDLPPKNFDYSIVQTVLKEIDQYTTEKQLVVLISTVLPGTVRKYLRPCLTNARFVYNPYLIAMGTVKWDMVNPECIIIGTEDGSITGDAKILTDFYKPLMENDPRINIGTWEEAEAIKIFYNTFISAKIGLVNMIQDVAESIGNMNVDVVTDALKNATQRITGPRYLTAGMGDAGACHPRDNIALRWLAQELDLGYDLFHAIMESRDAQAKRLAATLVKHAKESASLIYIHGKAYKPNVPYIEGSYSLLVGNYCKELGYHPIYIDPLTGDSVDVALGVILLAHNPQVTYGKGEQKMYCKIQSGSIIIDPWRTYTSNDPKVKVFYYGNSRQS